MRKLIFSINITPDGFCDHTAARVSDELHRYYTGLLKEVDMVLFGRVTFQLFESYWPLVTAHASGSEAENEFAQTIDDMSKIMFSKTLKRTEWKNTSIINDHLEDEVLKLKAMPGHALLLLGSPCIATSLMRAGLIDEFHFCMQPVIAGAGKRFFETDALEKHIELKHKDTKSLSSGVVVIYQLAEDSTAALSTTLQESF